jgi:hypothetical protein
MSRQERQPESLEPAESLDPRHFYAAYVFDRSNERKVDIEAIIEKARELNYPLRYWWLSDAMELQGFPDRLIVCVHHPSTSEDAGMDLYHSLKEKQITWDDLEAAAVDEYRYLGKPVFELGDLRSPFGNWLFPEDRRLPNPEDALLVITPENIRAELQGRLGQEVSDEELSAVLVYFKTAIDLLGWTFYLDEALNMSVEARQERWDAGSAPNASTDIPTAGS